MAVALEAVDIVAICACVLLLALLYLTLGLSKAIARAIDVSILGTHPFGGIANAINNSIVSWVNTAIDGVQSAIVTLFNGLIWSFKFMVNGVRDLANGVEDAVTHAWNVTLHNTFRDIYDWTHAHFQATTAHFATLEHTVAGNLTEAEHYALTHAEAAERAAKAYVDTKVTELHTFVASHIHAAIQGVEGELTFDVNAIRGRIDNVVHELRAAESAAEQAINLPGDILNDLDKLAKEYAGAAGIGALLAAIPLLVRELSTFEKQTGLEELRCRTNVKGICGVDPSLWEGLLAGLVIADIGIHLSELAGLARETFHVLTDVVREAA